jgi:TonB family protein
VRDAKGYWQKSGLDYQPEIIYQLSGLLYLKDVLRVRSKQTLGKIKDREKDGVRQKCVEVKWARATDRVLCFDDSNGTLLSIEYQQGENQTPPEISRIEYSTFNSVGGKLVPYEIRALKDRKVIASVRVLEIAKTPEVNPALFIAPTNAEFWAQCDDLQESELIDRVQPKYPISARTNGTQGRVILYAVIEADGSLSHLAIIQGVNPDLNAAAAQAIRQWRYKPAMCDQTAIRVETSISADFWLEH